MMIESLGLILTASAPRSGGRSGSMFTVQRPLSGADAPSERGFDRIAVSLEPGKSVRSGPSAPASLYEWTAGAAELLS